MAQPLLDIRDVVTVFRSGDRLARAVDTASLSLEQGETLGVVGESGCGKTVLALSVMGLVPDPPGRVVEGEILYRGRNLLAMSERELRDVRGNHISMIFQEPMTSLNPVFQVGDQIAEAVALHQDVSRRGAQDKAVEMLRLVGIPNPERRVKSYPHELSGGMRQRVMIAMALSCDPDVLIADEPTTALDVTIQAQILDLMDKLKDKKGASVLLITHDLGVVARAAHSVAVMYAGQVVERAGVHELFHDPLHPYTRGLLASAPTLGVKRELAPIRGNVPSIFDKPPGCEFHPRCPRAFERCPREKPPLYRLPDGRTVRCFLYGQ
ncbi:MAG: ABC transporter ATP-binding protein [Desulfovibrionaceae bacterium]